MKMNTTAALILATRPTATINTTIDHVPDQERAPIIVANLMLGLAVTLTNGLVIFAYIIRKQVRTRISQFLINLAVADFFSGCIAIPLNTFYGRSRTMLENVSDSACIVILSCPTLLATMAVLSIVMVAVDRLISILHPFQYAEIVTPKRSGMIIALVWLYAILYSTAPGLFPGAMDSPVSVSCSGTYAYGSGYAYMLVFGIVIPAMVTVMTIYLIIYRIANRHVKELQKLFVARNPTPEQRKLNSNSKAAKTAFFITALFVISWVPFLMSLQVVVLAHLGIIQIHDQQLKAALQKSIAITATMAYIISAVNPVIYCLRDRVLKHHVKSILTCGRCKSANIGPNSGDLDGHSVDTVISVIPTQ